MSNILFEDNNLKDEPILFADEETTTPELQPVWHVDLSNLKKDTLLKIKNLVQDDLKQPVFSTIFDNAISFQYIIKTKEETVDDKIEQLTQLVLKQQSQIDKILSITNNKKLFGLF